jgi:hypothetical protein
MLAPPVPGKIGVAVAWTEEAVLKKENVSNVCELTKEKEFIKKKRLNAQEWVQRGLGYLGSKNYEDAKKAFQVTERAIRGALTPTLATAAAEATPCPPSAPKNMRIR